MADSMCGPSNAGKNLLNHVDRDRSLHQDRLAGAPQAGLGNTFRSQTQFTNGAEAAFANFQQAGPVMEPAVGPGLDMSAMVPGPRFAPAGPSQRAAVPGVATGNALGQDWVAEFSGMQIGAGNVGPSSASAMRVQAHAATMAPMAARTAPFAAGPMFGAGALGGFRTPAMMNTFAPAAPIKAQADAAVAATAEAAVTAEAEAFDRAFGEYDKLILENDLADWAEKQKAYDAEFAKEQDKWMAEHGPRVQPPTEAEMAKIDADLEQLAEEQDKEREMQQQRANDEALARAAADIVSSVADNTSDKFKKSHFFELMRRISNREVVVAGDAFVDAETGEKVNTSHIDDDEDDGVVAAANGNGTGNGLANGTGAALFPDAPYNILETAAFYNIWLFLWDDAIDGSGDGELSDAEDYCQRSVAFVEHALRCSNHDCFCCQDDKPSTPGAPTKVCASFADVARSIRTLGEGRPDDPVELVGRLREYMEGCVTEYQWRMAGTVPSVEQFYSWRLRTSSVDAFLVLTRILNGITLRYEILESEEVTEMGLSINKLLIQYVLACQGVKYAPLKSGQKDGAFGNLIPITMRELGIDLEGAVNHIVQHIHQCIQDYDRHASAIRATATQQYPDSVDQLDRLIAAYQCIATTVLNFSIHSPRYGLLKYRQPDESFLVEL
ncbi:hypothetical protein VTJ49DRAFT_5732 [Mycothermus thermophilus]|uniref:Nuclear pore protein n=1 Tax=Humicola insolens TaxID=85995 RepID=A0ABR3VKB5_HUMIN